MAGREHRRANGRRWWAGAKSQEPGVYTTDLNLCLKGAGSHSGVLGSRWLESNTDVCQWCCSRRLTFSSVCSPQLLAYRSSSLFWLCAILLFPKRMETISYTRPLPQVRPLGPCALVSSSLEPWVFALLVGDVMVYPTPQRPHYLPVASHRLRAKAISVKTTENWCWVLLTTVTLWWQEEAPGHLAFLSRSH